MTADVVFGETIDESSQCHKGLTMAKLIIVSIVALAVIVSGAIFSEAVSFKKDILTQQMPSLLAGLLAVATITERATAVLNNIWFGRSRVEAQDGVRLAIRKVHAAEKKATLAQAAQQALAAYVAGGPPAQVTVGTNQVPAAQVASAVSPTRWAR